jgi:phosphatidylinositol 4-kinase A
MSQLLDPGGRRDSPQFFGFVELCVRGFLAARTAAEPIIAAVSLMRESGLPCFGYGEPIGALRRRFMLERTDAQAAAAFRERVDNAYDSFSTGFYDFVQYLQNAIPK